MTFVCRLKSLNIVLGIAVYLNADFSIHGTIHYAVLGHVCLYCLSYTSTISLPFLRDVSPCVGFCWLLFSILAKKLL